MAWNSFPLSTVCVDIESIHEMIKLLATSDEYVHSNKPPYDMVNNKHGIPVDNTLNIIIWPFFSFEDELAVMFTNKFRVRSHRWIWMERRMNIELRLIAHIVPFPVLSATSKKTHHPFANNNIYLECDKVRAWTILLSCIPNRARHTLKLKTESFQRLHTEGPRTHMPLLGMEQLQILFFLLNTCDQTNIWTDVKTKHSNTTKQHID